MNLKSKIFLGMLSGLMGLFAVMPSVHASKPERRIPFIVQSAASSRPIAARPVSAEDARRVPFIVQSAASSRPIAARPVSAEDARRVPFIVQSARIDLVERSVNVKMGKDAADYIARFLDFSETDWFNVQSGETNLWNVLVEKQEWSKIKHLLGTDAGGSLSFGVVCGLRNSFVWCVKNSEDNSCIYSNTPVSLAQKQGTVNELIDCLDAGLMSQISSVLNIH